MNLIEHAKMPALLPSLARVILLPRKGVKPKDQLPVIVCRAKHVKVNQLILDQYCNLAGITDSDELPPLFPHALAGPLHMDMLGHEIFPMKLLGATHKYNSIEVFGKLPRNGEYMIEVKLGKTHYHQKGIEFEMETLLYLDDKLVWKGVSTQLKSMKFRELPLDDRGPFISPAECHKEIDNWKIPFYAGKVYALLCKDFNPIHISYALAKVFGFQRDLAHGFFVAARACNTMKSSDLIGKKWKVYFKGPSYMGKHLTLLQSNDERQRWDIRAKGNDRPIIALEIE